MEQVVLSLISGLLGAIVGGAMALWGSMKSLNTTMANLERAEIRRMRVECVTNLAGLRGLLGEAKHIVTEADAAKLMFELNRISTLWSHDAEVLRAVRDFIAEPQNKDRLFRLIRTISRSTALNLENLGDADMNAVFQLNMPQKP
jgi:hypothetical protein